MLTPKLAGDMLVLHIELAEVTPKVWREIVVPDSITLPELHVAVQITMGWRGGHMHEFQIDHRSYGTPDPSFPDEVLSERRVSLGQALGGTRKFVYLYDFGDDWHHTIKIRKTMPRDPSLKLPCCTGGENACPPEDIGGPWGYEEFLAAISDPQHEKYDTMLKWCGGEFDPTRFNLASVNARLSTMKV
ncbi:plasmid pRiA4b ORF-3 family protein [Chromobacterium haemolyticum]|uniref:plasmid pRiA4b ORF-3 family protein n=1 Tax=Chromobacterium haemolyticum TaxID=394935 RepID=UPI002449D759|nr:plasmid pRiA4b ORF-3 family protein [Chromobacterium haemolyticum]MDH0342068.1 plasmid pRiA4b ORF-3 family protein [Chromobacterium haemolyticum]